LESWSALLQEFELRRVLDENNGQDLEVGFSVNLRQKLNKIILGHQLNQVVAAHLPFLG
jgi:hypothetical protein